MLIFFAGKLAISRPKLGVGVGAGEVRDERTSDCSISEGKGRKKQMLVPTQQKMRTKKKAKILKRGKRSDIPIFHPHPPLSLPLSA